MSNRLEEQDCSADFIQAINLIHDFITKDIIITLLEHSYQMKLWTIYHFLWIYKCVDFNRNDVDDIWGALSENVGLALERLYQLALVRSRKIEACHAV